MASRELPGSQDDKHPSQEDEALRRARQGGQGGGTR